MRSHNKTTSTFSSQKTQQTYQTRQQQLKRLKSQRSKLIQNKITSFNEHVKMIFQATINLLINYNLTFVSKYTILYKSYMILTAFLLTIIGNYLWAQSLPKIHQENKQGIMPDKYPFEEWVQLAAYILPLKGRFSLLFFQLMLLTTIQIFYETIIELHYRLSSVLLRKIKKNSHQQSQDHQRSQYFKEIDSLSKFIKVKMEEEIQCERYQKMQQMQNGQYSEQKTIVSKVDKVLTPLTFLLQNCKQINGRKVLFETKFIYLFALMYAENIIWQGIIVKRWKQRFVHLVIIGCCMVQFLIWTMINIVLQASQNIEFGDKQFIQLGPNCQISLGMY